MKTRKDLHSYQIKLIDHIKKNKKCGLFLGMGLGKTVLTLTAIKDLIDQKQIKKVLIIAPLRVANSTWHNEIKQWNHLQDLKYTICTGSIKKRIKGFCSNVNLYITNRENINWLVDNYKDCWNFDTVVVDESSSFKNHKAQRFKKLHSMYDKINRMVILTGTPSPRCLMDVWSQIALLDNGERLGKFITFFQKKYFIISIHGYNSFFQKFTPKPDSDKKIYEQISDIVVSLKTEECIDLPERIDLTVKVYLQEKILKHYRELEKKFVTNLFENDLSASSAATLSNKLLQFCNGSAYDEEGNSFPIHDEKIKALKEIVEDNPNENILVAYNYKFDLEVLKKEFPDAVVLNNSQDTIDKWNKGEIRMLLAHPASCGYGLNLQHGGCLIVWYGLNWSLELYQQFNARLHRQGQKSIVRIIHLVVDNCIDEKVCRALIDKAENQDKLLEALKLDFKQ